MKPLFCNIAARIAQATTILCLTSMASTPSSAGVADDSVFHEASSSSSVTLNDSDREAWFWGDLELLTTLLCLYFGCDEPTPWISVDEAVVIDRIEAQIAEYEANGIDPSLTQAERASMLVDAQQTEAHIDENSGILDPVVEADYLGMLADVIGELES